MSDSLANKRENINSKKQTPKQFINEPLRRTFSSLRGHVLYDAVEKVKSLMIIGLGCYKLLENSKQARLRKKVEETVSIYLSQTIRKKDCMFSEYENKNQKKTCIVI